MNKELALYYYKATVTRVIDGDTIVCNIDLGMGVWMGKQYIRLYGINAPEVKGESRNAGLAAKGYLLHLTGDGEVVLRTHKDKTGKFGRWLADIYKDGQNLNDLMVDNGHAVNADY